MGNVFLVSSCATHFPSRRLLGQGKSQSKNLVTAAHEHPLLFPVLSPPRFVQLSMKMKSDVRPFSPSCVSGCSSKGTVIELISLSAEDEGWRRTVAFRGVGREDFNSKG